jgi:hypothetical protein
MVFLESLGLILRGLAGVPLEGSGARVLYNLAFVVAFTLLSLPFAYAFVGAARIAGRAPGWLRWFPGRTGLALTAGVLVILTAVALTRDVYGPRWHRVVRAEQRYALGEETGRIVLTSGEYLDGLRVNLEGHDTVLHGRGLRFAPEPSASAAVAWLTVRDTVMRREATAAGDSAVSLDRELTIASAFRPLSVRVTYSGRDTVHVESPWSSGSGRRSAPDDARRTTFFWYSYPAANLRVPLRIRLGPRQRVTETIEVTYDSLASACRLERDLTSVIARTVVTRSDTIDAGL